MKLLIIYGTTEGQTRKICEFLHKEAINRNYEVTLHDASRTDSSPDPAEFDAVIVAASVHTGKYQSSITHFVQKHQEVLNKVPGLFLSVSLVAATDEPKSWEELKKITKQFFDKTKWHPVLTEYVAGALRYSEYNFFKKFIMRLIAQKSSGDTDTSQDYEYTDWDQVKRILPRLEKEVAKSLKSKV